MRPIAPLFLACLLAACDLPVPGPKATPTPAPSPAGPKFTAISLGAKAASRPGSKLGNVSAITGIQMLDAGTGYAVGAERVVLKTTDGGQTWDQVAARAPEDNVTRLESYTDLAFSDAMNGLVLAPGGCFATHDGGASWTPVKGLDPGFYISLAQLGPTDGYAVGNGRVARTTDGGVTWQPEQLPEAFDTLTDFNTIAGQPAVLGARTDGRSVLLVRGQDGWRSLKAPDGQGLGAFDFRDADNGWVVGGTVFKTFDAAQSWVQAVTTVAGGAGTRVKLISDAEAWVAGRNGVSVTTTGGVHWATTLPVDPESTQHFVKTSGGVGHSGLQYRGPNDIWLANGSRAVYHYTGN